METQSAESGNFRHLAKYFFFNSIAIAIAANGVITDMLLLKMNFDLDRLGMIKGHIYFLPAVSYLLFFPLLRKSDRDIDICAWSYLLRCIFPLTLPVLYLLNAGQEVLLWGTAAVFALSFSCACFANNTLLKVMQRAFPKEKLNRYALFLTYLPNVPCGLLCIAAGWWLTKNGSDPRRFMYWLLALQTVCLIFEYPAIRNLRKVRMQNAAPAQVVRFFPPRKVSKACTMMFGIMLVHGIWLGLMTTYFVIFLLKEIRINPAVLLWIEFGLSSVTLALCPLFGKWSDRIGYAPVFSVTTLLIAAVVGIWSLIPGNLLMLGLTVAFVYNGNNGIATGMLRQTESIGTIHLSEKGAEEYTVGIGNLLCSAGSFFGCLAAGWLFRAVNGNFPLYFRWCSAVFLLFVLIVLLWLIQTKLEKKRTTLS